MTRCAQLIKDNCEVDFIDINMGCPIDLIYQKGGGSGLMDRRRKLDEIIYGLLRISINSSLIYFVNFFLKAFHQLLIVLSL